MKKLNNKISIAGIFLFCTIVVGFVFVQTPLNLGFVIDGGSGNPPPQQDPNCYYPYHYLIELGDTYGSDSISRVWVVDNNYFQIRNYYRETLATVWFEFPANAKAEKVIINLHDSSFWYVDIHIQYTDGSYADSLHRARTDGVTINMLTDNAKTIEYVKIYAHISVAYCGDGKVFCLNIDQVIAEK